MKNVLLITLFCCLISIVRAQITLPPNGENQKASVSQWMGPVEVRITYSRPDVHAPDGRDRKDHIWGQLVAYGFTDQGFGTSKAAPWRAGANENTTITFSHDVKVEGKELKAGTYGFFIAVEKEGPWTLIFSNNSESWGSFFYNPAEDALRVQVNAEDAVYTEWLTYGFEDCTRGAAKAFLQWENKKVPFKIEVPQVNELYISTIRNELRSAPGFSWQSWTQAASFCVFNKINLEEALTWADNAISLPFIGQENFNTLQVKSNVLNALNRTEEANKVMDKAINHPTANVQGIHQYGRSLIAAGKPEKAMEVFQLNRKRNPDDLFTTFVGLARGYEALGDKKNAIKNWEIAIKNIPANQKQNTALYEGELKRLKEESKPATKTASGK
jgi:hypothetical protein